MPGRRRAVVYLFYLQQFVGRDYLWNTRTAASGLRTFYTMDYVT